MSPNCADILYFRLNKVIRQQYNTKTKKMEHNESETVGNIFDNFCRNKLQRVDLPIKLGPTDYLTIDKEVLKQMNGWCEDKYGRLAVACGGTFFFQRYNDRYIFVKSTDGKTFTHARDSDLQDVLQELW